MNFQMNSKYCLISIAAGIVLLFITCIYYSSEPSATPEIPMFKCGPTRPFDENNISGMTAQICVSEKGRKYLYIKKARGISFIEYNEE